MESENDVGLINLDEARRLLQADLEQKREACSREIAAVLDRYGLTLAAVPVISTDGRIAAQLTYAPKGA